MKQKNQIDPAATEEELTPRQQRLLVELVKNPDIQAAAKAAGVGRTSTYRWLKQPAFETELSRLRNLAMNEALSTVKAHTARAATELTGLLDTQDERLKRQICNDILTHAIRVREQEEIERRLTALERKIDLKEKSV